MLKRWLLLSLFLVLGVGILLPDAGHAQIKRTFADQDAQLSNTVAPTGISTEELKPTIGRMIRGALTGISFIFFALVIYGGFLWMTDRGNEDQAQKAKDIIVAALIGLAIIIGAYAITNLAGRLINRVGSGTTTTTNPTCTRDADCPKDQICSNDTKTCITKPTPATR